MEKFDQVQRFSRIDFRLPSLVLLFCCLLAIITASVHSYATYHTETSQIRERIERMGMSHVAALTQGLRQSDEEQIRVHLESILQFSNVLAVRFETKVLAPILLGNFLINPGIEVDIPIVLQQIVLQDNKINNSVANLRIHADSTEVMRQLPVQALVVLGEEFAKALVIVLFLWWVMKSLVTRRLIKIAEAIQTTSVSEFERPQQISTVVTRDGAYDELSSLVTAIDVRHNKFAASYAALRVQNNKLERKFRERAIELGQAKQEVQKANQLKSGFLSTINHEIRTPLTAIRGSLGLLVGGAVGSISAESAEPLNIAHNNSNRLLAMVEDILDVSNMESGQLTLNRQCVNLKSFLVRAVASNAHSAKQHAIEIRLLNCPEDVTVDVDQDRMIQVMRHLISNAVKFSSRGSRVDVYAEVSQLGVEVSVLDYGPGVAARFEEQLFEKFSQADNSTTRKVGGVGLGLHFTRSLIEMHGGVITFENVPEAGARFYFRLPVCDQISLVTSN